SVRKFDLQASSPKFWDLIPHDANLKTVATGFGFTEGPVWDPSGFLYVSDETLNKIFRVHLNDGRKQEFISLGDPDGNTYDRMGSHFLLTAKGFTSTTARKETFVSTISDRMVRSATAAFLGRNQAADPMGSLMVSRSIV